MWSLMPVPSAATTAICSQKQENEKTTKKEHPPPPTIDISYFWIDGFIGFSSTCHELQRPFISITFKNTVLTTYV